MFLNERGIESAEMMMDTEQLRGWRIEGAEQMKTLRLHLKDGQWLGVKTRAADDRRPTGSVTAGSAWTKD